MDSTSSFSPYRPDGKLVSEAITTSKTCFLCSNRDGYRQYGFVCVVTGADKPVGRAITVELAACSQSATKDAEAEVVKSFPNTKVISYPLHATSEEDTLALVDDVLNQWGRLDVWVTSSGLLGPSSITETGPNELLKCFETNSMAPFYAVKYAPAAMGKTTEKRNYPNAAPKEEKYGSIIVVSSVANTHGGCWGPALTMSSHAALGLVKSGVASLKGTGVRINCIAPGQIDVGISLKDFDMRGMNAQLPPSSLGDV
ncbi:MAG: hypothetical protein M1831_007281 [Alyxoria varia]|nr:MAG: hypothetical protein M1831_007281 [Alyxoria varia]